MRFLTVVTCALLMAIPTHGDTVALTRVVYISTTGAYPYNAVRFWITSAIPAGQDVKIKTVSLLNPDGTTTALADGTLELNPSRIRGYITFPDNIRPGSNAKQVSVTLTSGGNDIVGTGAVITDATIAQFADDERNKFNDATQAAKSGTDKDFLAGLNVAIPAGGGDTQGNVDSSFSKEWGKYDVLSGHLFDQVVLAGALKKGSETLADPRHFQIGGSLRKDILLASRKDVEALRNANLDQPTDVGDMTEVANSLGKHVFNALFVDTGLGFEGDLKGTAIGNVSNFLFTFDPRLVSPNYASGSGFAVLRLQPAAFEGGYNVQNNDNAAAANRSLLRYRAGATATVAYNFTGLPLARIELELNALTRYLFRNENAYDPIAKSVTSVTKGNHYYAEGNFKLFFSNAVKGRAGIQVSFKRGQLPPVYADTKAFNVGFIYETSDDLRKAEK